MGVPLRPSSPTDQARPKPDIRVLPDVGEAEIADAGGGDRNDGESAASAHSDDVVEPLDLVGRTRLGANGDHVDADDVRAAGQHGRVAVEVADPHTGELRSE